MITLNVNNQKVIDKLGNQVFSNYAEALEFATDEMGWNKDEVLDRNEDLSLKLEDGSIINTNLPCLIMDSGSEDYLFYIS